MDDKITNKQVLKITRQRCLWRTMSIIRSQDVLTGNWLSYQRMTLVILFWGVEKRRTVCRLSIVGAGGLHQICQAFDDIQTEIYQFF